jgi:hypothetical protein
LVLLQLFALPVAAQKLVVSELLKIFLRLQCGLFPQASAVVARIT